MVSLVHLFRSEALAEIPQMDGEGGATEKRLTANASICNTDHGLRRPLCYIVDCEFAAKTVVVQPGPGLVDRLRSAGKDSSASMAMGVSDNVASGEGVS